VIKTRFRGKTYRVVAKRMPKEVGAYCTNPAENKANRLIALRKRLRSPEVILENLLHEGLHAAIWDLDEEAVLEIASDLATLLVKAGVTLDVSEVYKRLSE